MATVDPASYLAASAFSSLVTFPLWKAAAIGQSNYVLDAKTPFLRYWQAIKPPWTGSLAVVSGMAWARAAIFVGSEKGGIYLKQLGYGAAVSTILPTLSISTFVSVVNQPFVRSTVMLQDPHCIFGRACFPNLAVIRHLVSTKGVGALWLGTNAAILKTAPKFIAAVAIKDGMEKVLAPVDSTNKSAQLIRSLKKSLAAGSIGAVLTNPLDVVRNEMFKTDEQLSTTCRRLCREEGFRWLTRGCERNLISVAAPITGTIFMADIISDAMRS
mmetsp:Transcript_13685/g.25928  ORF Transcript_13685/g.25928 Transcript_13685/m.25928 type:complete len:271 (-) Transcript_13685:195-1007(-)